MAKNVIPRTKKSYAAIKRKYNSIQEVREYYENFNDALFARIIDHNLLNIIYDDIKEEERIYHNVFAELYYEYIYIDDILRFYCIDYLMLSWCKKGYIINIDNTYVDDKNAKEIIGDLSKAKKELKSLKQDEVDKKTEGE